MFHVENMRPVIRYKIDTNIMLQPATLAQHQLSTLLYTIQGVQKKGRIRKLGHK